MHQWPNSDLRLGDRLRYLRTLKNMTQAELAQKLDISLRQYNRVERGESQPTISLLERICSVLDSCLSTLFLVFDAEGRSDCLKRAGRNQAVCGQSLTGMWALRTGSAPPRWSASLYQLLGYTPFSVKPTLHRFLKHVSPEDQSACKTFIDAAKQPGNIESQFLHIITKSSEKRFVTLSRDFFPGEKNDEDPYILVQDVTDQILMDRDLVRGKEQLENYVREKNSELELTLDRYQQEISERIKAEEFLNIYKMMVRNSNDAQIFVDSSGIIVLANTAYEKLINIPAAKIIGQVFKTFISSKLGDAHYDLEIQPCLDSVFLRGREAYRDGWIFAETGRRYLSRCFIPCRDEEKITGVIITIHDLTHLMIARDQLAESEGRFRNLLANVPNVAVQGYRMDGATIYWNQASEQLYGYSAEEVVGRNLLDLIIPPEMREEVKTAMQHMAQTGETIPASELWLMHKDGSSVPVYSSHAIVKKENAPPELFCIDIDLTERLQAEKAVLEQKYYLRSILDTTRDGFCIVDLQGNLVDVNEAYCHMSGHTREELLRLHIKDLAFDETPSEIAERLARILTNGCELFEVRHRKCDGTFLNIEISATFLNENGGQIVSFLRDITERKQAEEALRQREQLLEVTASATLNLLRGKKLGPCIEDVLAELGRVTNTDRVYIFTNHLDQQGGALLTSQAYEWVRSGISPQIDNPGLQNVNLDDLCPRWVKEMASGNAIMGFVGDFPDEERAILEPQEIQSLLAVPIQINGDFWGFIGFDSVRSPRDWSVTEANVLKIIATAIGAAITRKTMERALRIKDQAIVSSMDAVALADMDGRISYVNPSFLKIWGLKCAEDTVGRHVTDFWHDVGHAAQVMGQILEHGSATGRMIARRADGTLVTVQPSANMVRDDTGNPVCMMASFRDMTEQMNHERELAEARDVAEAASRAKSDFLAKMSHEVRTPLSGIVGLVSLLVDTPLDEEQREYLAHIATASEKMLNLLCSLLDLSKIEAGKIELENEPFSPRWTVEEVVNLMISVARQKNLALKWYVAEDVPDVLRGDMGRLRQILLNLVGNAVKFTDQGAVDLCCGVEMSDGPRALLRFTVKDTGIGIPADQIDALFSPYVRGKNVKTRYSGTGLGLAICKELVELMGGEIRVESTEGEGSTFWFTAWFWLLEAVGEG